MGGATRLTNSFLSLLIASLGVSVTEVQDVVFKYVDCPFSLYYFARKKIVLIRILL